MPSSSSSFMLSRMIRSYISASKSFLAVIPLSIHFPGDKSSVRGRLVIIWTYSRSLCSLWILILTSVSCSMCSSLCYLSIITISIYIICLILYNPTVYILIYSGFNQICLIYLFFSTFPLLTSIILFNFINRKNFIEDIMLLTF